MSYGYLDHSEFDAFQKHLGKLHVADFELNARAPEKCVQASAGPAISIDLSYHEATHGIVHVSGADVCFDSAFIGSAEDAKLLQQWLDGLVQKYYPDLFPNPCVSAASELGKNFDWLKQCQQDSDCTYLDLNYLPANHPGIAVVVDDCSFIESLPVGNAFTAVANQRELLLQRELARKICGGGLAKQSCSHSLSFDSGSAAPLCVEGACRINPRVLFH